MEGAARAAPIGSADSRLKLVNAHSFGSAPMPDVEPEIIMRDIPDTAAAMRSLSTSWSGTHAPEAGDWTALCVGRPCEANIVAWRAENSAHTPSRHVHSNVSPLKKVYLVMKARVRFSSLERMRVRRVGATGRSRVGLHISSRQRTCNASVTIAQAINFATKHCISMILQHVLVAFVPKVEEARQRCLAVNCVSEQDVTIMIWWKLRGAYVIAPQP